MVYACLPSPLRATCPAPLFLLNLITWKIFGKENRVWSSSLCSHLHPPVTLSLLGTNTRWFKYDWDKLWLVYTQTVPVIFEPPCIFLSFNAMNSVHFCSITLRSNQMHYFYYLKLKTIYNLSLWYTTNCLQFFLSLPDMFRRLLRAIFRGIFKPNFLFSWPLLNHMVAFALSSFCLVFW
jgi:hypothetical protein